MGLCTKRVDALLLLLLLGCFAIQGLVIMVVTSIDT
jgi:hypothetical protein